ncbi:MAG: prepilin-type N-terminal cleavage/methylation domain-containing protein [Phycisphaerales bacterium]|nr:prepilin-type N-terminal cleavage/methylation domain-containing protein [Phycisphaerales bacterium]
MTPGGPAIVPVKTGWKAGPTRSAFTLIEMVVVIAIISLLLALVLPGAAAMWKQRNEAGTINLVRGLLESARSQARRAGERGLLFYVDPIDNIQRIAFIEAEPPNAEDDSVCIANSKPAGCITAPMAVYRYRVTSDKVYTVPSPYRVAPAVAMQWAQCIADDNASACVDGCPGPVQSVDTIRRRLGNNDFYIDDSSTTGAMKSPRQRNYFAVIFDRNGVLQVGRNVLVHDPNADDPSQLTGDKLRLAVTAPLQAMKFYNACGTTEDIRPTGVNVGLSNLVSYDSGVAAGFTSVAGLVVYDDSVAVDLASLDAGTQLASELLANGRPLFISRQTGDIIMGEKGR